MYTGIPLGMNETSVGGGYRTFASGSRKMANQRLDQIASLSFCDVYTHIGDTVVCMLAKPRSIAISATQTRKMA